MTAMEGVTYSKIREAEQYIVTKAVSWRKVWNRRDEVLKNRDEDDDGLMIWMVDCFIELQTLGEAIDDLISLTEEANDV